MKARTGKRQTEPDRYFPGGHPAGRPSSATWRGHCLESGLGTGGVEVGRAHLDTMAASVLHEGVRRIEPHGLRVQQRSTEHRRVVRKRLTALS